MAKILLLDRFSNYGFMNIHIKNAHAAFKRMGHEAKIFNMSDDYFETLPQKLAEGWDLVFSISYFGHVRVKGRTIMDMGQCPHVVMHLDHPSFFYDWVNETPEGTIVTWLDASHIDYVEREWGPNRFAAQACVPPGGNIDTPPTDETLEQFIEQRDIPMLFTGTFHGPPERRWRTEFPAEGVALMDTVADIALSAEELPIHQALDIGAQALGWDADHPIVKAVHHYIYLLSLYIHDHRRYEALTALSRAGVPVHIYGKGFESHMHRFPGFQYGGVGNFYETLGLIQRSQIVLNSNTNFSWGAHERVFAAQRGGALVLSDTSKWYREHLKDGENIQLYQWLALDEMPKIAHDLLDDPTRLFRMAQAGRREADAHHTWANRLQDILKLAGIASANEQAA
mgnify:CR=1 FL=1